MLHQMHTPTHHRSSKSFITRGNDGDLLHWPIHLIFCTGYCYLLLVTVEVASMVMYLNEKKMEYYVVFCFFWGFRVITTTSCWLWLYDMYIVLMLTCACDLNHSGGETVKRNMSVSRLYILYQMFTVGSSILGPASVTLMIAGRFRSSLLLYKPLSNVCSGANIVPVALISTCVFFLFKYRGKRFCIVLPILVHSDRMLLLLYVSQPKLSHSLKPSDTNQIKLLHR